MAQHKSAKKRIRQIERRTKVNRHRMSRIRTYIKSVETAIADGNRDAALTGLRQSLLFLFGPQSPGADIRPLGSRRTVGDPQSRAESKKVREERNRRSLLDRRQARQRVAA